MNSIIEQQNGPIQLQRLAAQRQQYSTAKLIIGTQLVLSGLVTVLFAFLGLAVAELKGYVALWGITILIADLVILTPWQKRLRESAAKIQEAFDCDVLSLPWHELKVGRMPDPELVQAQATKYSKWASTMPSLRDWYPVSVQQLPSHWGCFVCQRANCWWDSDLRRRYALAIIILLLSLGAGVIWYAFGVGMVIEDFIVKIAAPLIPTFALGSRQFTEHRDAADRLDKLKVHAEKLWTEALAGASIPAMKMGARALQDEIFDGRKRNPPIFDNLFRWLRSDQERLMNQGAEHFVAEAKKQLHAKSALN